MTLQETINGNANCQHRAAWSEFNDVLIEIAQLKSFSECIRIILNNFDETRLDSDNASYTHVNRMLSMLDMQDYKLDSLEATANKAFDTLYRNGGQL